jgi:hypothetical protein
MQSLNSARDSDAGSPPRRKPLTLWLILAVCAAPIIASYVAYYIWRPSGHVNYGELLEPRPLPDTALAALDGSSLKLSELKGSWVLLLPASAECDERCRASLVYIRQIRAAQGKESDRIERVWLLTDDGTPPGDVLAGQAGLRVVRGRGSDVLRALPNGAGGRIHVVDPLGNLMMRFPENADPRRVLRDVARLLRHSKWK